MNEGGSRETKVLEWMVLSSSRMEGLDADAGQELVESSGIYSQPSVWLVEKLTDRPVTGTLDLTSKAVVSGRGSQIWGNPRSDFQCPGFVHSRTCVNSGNLEYGREKLEFRRRSFEESEEEADQRRQTAARIRFRETIKSLWNQKEAFRRANLHFQDRLFQCEALLQTSCAHVLQQRTFPCRVGERRASVPFSTKSPVALFRSLASCESSTSAPVLVSSCKAPEHTARCRSFYSLSSPSSPVPLSPKLVIDQVGLPYGTEELSSGHSSSLLTPSSYPVLVEEHCICTEDENELTGDVRKRSNPIASLAFDDTNETEAEYDWLNLVGGSAGAGSVGENCDSETFSVVSKNDDGLKRSGCTEVEDVRAVLAALCTSLPIYDLTESTVVFNDACWTGKKCESRRNPNQLLHTKIETSEWQLSSYNDRFWLENESEYGFVIIHDKREEADFFSTEQE